MTTKEAQSEAPSVVDELDKLLISFAGAIRKEVLALGSNDPSYEVKPLFYPLKAKINRLIVEAELRGFDKAFDSHDYDGLREYRKALSNNLSKK